MRTSRSRGSSLASPHYRHGGRSAYFPKGMREDYERAVNDPRRWAFDENVALVDALLCDRLRALCEESQDVEQKASVRQEILLLLKERWRIVSEEIRRQHREAMVLTSEQCDLPPENWSSLSVRIQRFGQGRERGPV